MNNYKKHSNSNPLYRLWKSTRQKCQNPSNTSYKSYGAKGIKFYQPWEDFDIFYRWALSNNYQDRYSLLRYDESSDYSPDNCYFSPKYRHHGFSDTRLYVEWRQMLNRCQCPSHKSFSDYGGRGISVCAEWQVFETYKDWAISHGYSDNLTIDRKDVNGNYEPSNCRFVDMVAQCNNRRSSKFLTYQGRTLSMSQWSRELGISRFVISARVKQGLPIEEILRKELHAHRGENHSQNLITFQGMTLNQQQWADKIGISPSSLGRRLKRMSIEEALSLPKRE